MYQSGTPAERARQIEPAVPGISEGTLASASINTFKRLANQRLEFRTPTRDPRRLKHRYDLQRHPLGRPRLESQPEMTHRPDEHPRYRLRCRSIKPTCRKKGGRSRFGGSSGLKYLAPLPLPVITSPPRSSPVLSEFSVNPKGERRGHAAIQGSKRTMTETAIIPMLELRDSLWAPAGCTRSRNYHSRSCIEQR